MMKSLKSNYIEIVMGVALLVIGLCLSKFFVNPQGVMLAVPYVCIGLGCGIFGHGMGNYISYKAIKGNPEVKKQLNIDKNDESNIEIANKSKAKAYDIMTFVYVALIVCFALMGIDVIAILLLVFTYLFVQGYGIYYRCKYDKEM